MYLFKWGPAIYGKGIRLHCPTIEQNLHATINTNSKLYIHKGIPVSRLGQNTSQHDFPSGVGCFAWNTFHVQILRFRCMLGGQLEVWTKNILHQFVEGQIHFGVQSRGCSSFEFKHYLRACITSGKTSLILHSKQPIENHGRPTLDKKTHGVQG